MIRRKRLLMKMNFFRKIVSCRTTPAYCAGRVAVTLKNSCMNALFPALGRKLPAESFDVITCFELIEHLNEEAQREFMENARSLLAPGGELIISTPNPVVTTNYGENPYHLREMDEDEFRDLLGAYFSHVQILGQWIRPSIALSAHSEADQAVDFCELKGDLTGAQVPIITSNYVAVCSQQPLRQSRELCYFDSSFDYVAAAVALENRLHQSQFESYRMQEIVCNQEKTFTSQIENLLGVLRNRDEEIAAFKGTKIYRLRHTVRCEPFSIRKLVKVTYLLAGMLTPQPVRKKLN